MNIKLIILNILFLTSITSCSTKKSCSYKYTSIPIKMKYLSFDLEVHLDTLFTYHSVFYESSKETHIVFSNNQTPSIMSNNEYSLVINGPLSEGELSNAFSQVNPDVNIQRKIRSFNHEDRTMINEVVILKCALGIYQTYEMKTPNRNPFKTKCLPKFRIRNLVFDDKYSDWLEPNAWTENPWFSIEGIDESTIFDNFD